MIHRWNLPIGKSIKCLSPSNQVDAVLLASCQDALGRPRLDLLVPVLQDGRQSGQQILAKSVENKPKSPTEA